MVWPRRFVAVPTRMLEQDDAPSRSAKSTEEQLRGFVAPVPLIYEKLRAGATEVDFARMRRSQDSDERAAGDAYHYLFSPLGRDGRIEAEWQDGRLVVQRGRHRVEAARVLGVEVLPVHVRAQDERRMSEATDRPERQVEAALPGTASVHRQLDASHRSRDAARGRDNQPAPRDTTRGDNSATRPVGPLRDRT